MNSKYKVGIIRIDKTTALLQDLLNEHKDIRLDFDHLNGAYDGDLILAKGFSTQEVGLKQKLKRCLIVKIVRF